MPYTISTSRNGSVGAGKQENGMSESSNIQSQRILNRSGDVERGICEVTDSKNQSNESFFHQTQVLASVCVAERKSKTSQNGFQKYLNIVVCC